jgi:broad specificity phosphatase PhoE
MRWLAFLVFAPGILAPRPGALEAQASLIILARHAEKTAPAGDPGLTAEGEVRAADLARALRDVRLAAVITTQYQRTRLTAAPAARAARLTPVVVPAGNDLAAHATAIARVVDALPAGSAVLVVGHSNTLGAIIAALGGPRVPDLCDEEYATLFTLARPGPGGGVPHLVRGRFGAPGPADQASCNPMSKSPA